MFVLEVRGTQYRLFPLPLHTVRPFILDELDLTQPHEGDPGTAIKKNVSSQFLLVAELSAFSTIPCFFVHVLLFEHFSLLCTHFLTLCLPSCFCLYHCEKIDEMLKKAADSEPAEIKAKLEGASSSSYSSQSSSSVAAAAGGSRGSDKKVKVEKKVKAEVSDSKEDDDEGGGAASSKSKEAHAHLPLIRLKVGRSFLLPSLLSFALFFLLHACLFVFCAASFCALLASFFPLLAFFFAFLFSLCFCANL